MIEYDLPAGYTRFRATAGLDAAGAAQNTGGTLQFLVYTKNPFRPMPTDSAKVPVALAQLGLSGAYTVQDLWAGKPLGQVTGEFAPYVRRHGAKLYRLSKAKK